MSRCLRPLRALLLSALAIQLLSLPEGVRAADEKPPVRKPALYTISITGDVDAEMAPVAGQLTALFFQCYPKLVARFENPAKPAARDVTVVFKRDMKVPAYASGNKISVSVEWLREHPEDVALLTHELTHVVQAYPTGEPGWLTEGLADYARQVYGPKEQKNWSLPEQLTRRQSYKDSYRVTARFLVWLEAKHEGVVDKLHRRMQNREFETEDFKTFTGSSVETLWDECVRELEKKPKRTAP